MADDYENLRKSEVVVAKILSILLETGFQPSDLGVERLGLEASYEPFFELSVIWLMEEKIIRGHFIRTIDRMGRLAEPVITAYGFGLLGQNIIGGGEEKSNREAISQIVISPSGYSGIGDFIGGLLGGFTKSVSS